MRSEGFEGHRVAPGDKVKLAKIDAGATPGFKPGKKGGKAALEERLEGLRLRLQALQETLWAERRHKVLIVLQGMDTSGKDGTIRHVFMGVNPMGVRVALFKEPTAEELDHDFLWRAHAKVPGRGEMAIWNRSHYEDVLVARVRDLVPPRVWKARYAQINDFERMLAATGTTILKFFLHIDPEEQKERLRERLENPLKRWKFQRGDLEDRKLWDRYMDAYEDVLRKTSTEEAPWTIVPANKKWYRNLVVAALLVETLDGLGMKVPEPRDNLSDLDPSEIE